VPLVNDTMLMHRWKKSSTCCVSSQKRLWKGEEICMSNVNRGKILPFPKPPPSQPPSKMKQFEKPGLFKSTCTKVQMPSVDNMMLLLGEW
jgi:hypothetical protein